MYSIGERIVYPLHGAGVIEAIEEKEVLGETGSYLCPCYFISGRSGRIFPGRNYDSGS